MGLFGPPDVQKLKEKRNIYGLIEALRYKKDYHVRRDAARALGELKDALAVEPLIAALKDQDADVRIKAVEALEKFGDSRAVAPLITLLQDTNANVVKAAAYSLPGLNDGRMVEPLIVALNDERKEVRDAATFALGKIGAPAVAPLIATLEDKNRNIRIAAANALDQIHWKAGSDEAGALYWIAREKWEECVRIGAPAIKPLIAEFKESTHDQPAKALGKIGGPEAIDALSAVLSDKNVELRRHAIVALGDSNVTGAVDPLIAALKDEVAGVRKYAARALGKIGAQLEDAAVRARAEEPLIAALKDENNEVRWEAAEALGAFGDARSLEPLFKELKDRQMSYTVAKALGKIGVRLEDAALRDRLVESLIEVLKDQGSSGRGGAAAALREIGAQSEDAALCARLVEPLIAAFKYEDENRVALRNEPDNRGEFIRALGNLKDVRAVEPLLHVHLNDYHLSCDAAEALGRIGDARAVDHLIIYLNWESSDPTLGKTAIAALVRIGDGRAVEPLIRIIQAKKSAGFEEDAIEALGEIGDGRAVEPLFDVLKRGFFRQTIARALINLYRSGRIDDSAKKLILAHRAELSLPHEDQAPNKCFDHIDKATIEFPL